MGGLLIIAVAIGLYFYAIRHFQTHGKEDIASPITSDRLNKLWAYVDKAVKGGRLKATERALLAILKIDHKNTAAYNRLGMLYAQRGNLDDAIECFSIASSLTPTVATLFNLGLVHFEKGNYKDAANAFERVIDLEPNVKRYIAFAKALSKLGQNKRVAESLEKVVTLEPTARHYRMLEQAYLRVKDKNRAKEAAKHASRLERKLLRSTAKPRGRPKLASKRFS